jgi:8-oxo-dGTP pyrophosphatase MutT (NUDIX family)
MPKIENLAVFYKKQQIATAEFIPFENGKMPIDLAQIPICMVVILAEDKKSKKFIMVKNHKRNLELVAGHVEPLETPEQAALRELKEEAGAKLIKGTALLALGAMVYTRIPDDEYNKLPLKRKDFKFLSQYPNINATIYFFAETKPIKDKKYKPAKDEKKVKKAKLVKFKNIAKFHDKSSFDRTPIFEDLGEKIINR